MISVDTLEDNKAFAAKEHADFTMLANPDKKPAANVGAWLTLNVVDARPLPTDPGGITIRIAGAAIEVAEGFDPTRLRAVVQALATRPC